MEGVSANMTQDKEIEPQLVNVEDAAKLIGVTPHWIRVKSANKEFPADVCFKAGLYLVLDPKKLVDWIKSGSAARPCTGAGRPPKKMKYRNRKGV